VTTAPVDVTLAVSSAGPVGSLILFRTVGSLLASTAYFGGRSTRLKAIGAVPSEKISFLLKHMVINQVEIIKKKTKFMFYNL